MIFARSSFAQFMASRSGRVLRGAAGILLIAFGGTLFDTVWGPVLMVVGALPLIAAIFDVCFLSLLLGGPFVGQRIRDAGA